MQKVLLKAEERVDKGKGSARQLRRQGMLPAVLYGKGASTPITLNRKEIAALMVSGSRDHALVTIELTSGKSKKTNHWALVKDYQVDPLRNELLHVDFIEISLKEKTKVTVPIIITKEPVGVKMGGIQHQQLREVEIECLPTEIPDGIEVDASPIEIGHSIHVSDLSVKEGIQILADPHNVVLTVSAPVVEEVTPEAPAEEEGTEPELVKKTKEEEGAEEKGAEGKEQKKQKEQKKK